MLYFPLLGEQSPECFLVGLRRPRYAWCLSTPPYDYGALIMAVPKRRHSNSRTNSRRANHDKKEPRT